MAEFPKRGVSPWDVPLKAYIDEEAAAPALEALEVIETGRLSEGAVLPKTVGPRNLPRVKHGLKPALLIDSIYPKTGLAEWNHRILSATPGEWWAFGRDGTLRLSTHGDVWFPVYKAPATGQMGRQGLWLKTAAGSLITTWHPYLGQGDGASIMRSANGGGTWSTVVPAQAGVNFLGPCSIVQSPVTGKIFLIEYTATAPTAVTHARIHVSTDDGATWTLWKQITRDTADPAHVTHGHSMFVDPIDGRIWAAIGDAPNASGIYRLNAAETDWAPVATNAQLDTAKGIFGGAVGMMFFPDYIAWGVDQSYSSGLTRMARSEIGKPRPAVELVMKTNSTCFYAARSRPDNTEWVMCASQEGVNVTNNGAIDNAIHFYRVADNAATVDEIGALPHYDAGPSFSWAFPLGSPLQLGPEGMMWWGTNANDGAPNASMQEFAGTQFSARVGWSNQVIARPSHTRRYGNPDTFSTGHVASLAQNATQIFGTTIVPKVMRRLFVINAGAHTYNGTGPANPLIEVVDAAGNLIKEQAGTPMSFGAISAREVGQNDSAPFLLYTAPLPAGTEVRFRIKQVTSQAVACTGFITFAWGY